MKVKLGFIVLFIAFLSVSALGQVVITNKEVKYTRPKPQMDFKKTFSISYPKIKAATPAISRKIEAILSYEKVFGFTLREEMGEFQWLGSASYDVNYNANKLLSISLTIEGSAAYPSSSTGYIVVNTATGTRVRPIDVFTNTKELLAKLVKMKDTEIEKTKAEFKNDPDVTAEDLLELFTTSETYNKVSLDEFEIDENGVTFHHNYGFPHVAQALEPVGELFLSWKELKPFIKNGSVLAPLAR